MSDRRVASSFRLRYLGNAGADGLILHRYQTSIDRAGASIVLGGLLSAVLAVALVIMGGAAGARAVIATLLVAWLLSAMAITAVAGPVWLVLHRAGRRSARHAAAAGGIIGFVVFLAVQTHAFGLIDEPPDNTATILFRWASAAATSLILAIAAALIGVAMWRVAYYRAR